MSPRQSPPPGGAHLDRPEELLTLLRGEVTRPELHENVAHLRGCDACRRALAEVLIVHVHLTSAARILASPSLSRAPGESPTSPVADEDLPMLTRRRGRHLTRRLTALVAAVVLIVVAGVIGAVRLTTSEGTAAPSRSIALAPVTGDAAGRVTMTEKSRTDRTTDMRITTQGLAPAAPGHFYYAWLFDPSTDKMLPLGVVSETRPTTFLLADNLVSRYQAVDISLQADNGDPRHSTTSVLRARYS